MKAEQIIAEPLPREWKKNMSL